MNKVLRLLDSVDACRVGCAFAVLGVHAWLSLKPSLFLAEFHAPSCQVLCMGSLQLLEALVPVFGVGKSEGFALEPLMKFAACGFGSAKEDVRAAAVRITTLASSNPNNYPPSWAHMPVKHLHP